MCRPTGAGARPRTTPAWTDWEQVGLQLVLDVGETGFGSGQEEITFQRAASPLQGHGGVMNG